MLELVVGVAHFLFGVLLDWQLVANEDKVLLKGALAESCDPFLKFGTPCLSPGIVR